MDGRVYVQRVSKGPESEKRKGCGLKESWCWKEQGREGSEGSEGSEGLSLLLVPDSEKVVSARPSRTRVWRGRGRKAAPPARPPAQMRFHVSLLVRIQWQAREQGPLFWSQLGTVTLCFVPFLFEKHGLS